MPTETETPSATGAATVAAQEPQNMTADDLLGMLSETPDAEAPPEEETETSVAEEEEVIEESEQEEPGSVLERLGLANASDDELRELASNLGGRFGAELGELRRENRDLKASLQTELEKREPFELREETENPYATITSVDELRETYQSATETVKAGKQALRKHRNADPDDEIMEVGERTLTYSEVEDMVETAEEARDRHLPDRLKQLKQVQGYEEQRQNLLPEVQSIHAWMTDDESPLKKQVDATREKFLGPLQTHVPELVPYFDIILADHAASVAARANGNANAKPKPAAKKPPAGPGSAAAASSRPTNPAKKRADMVERFTKERRNMTADDLTQFLMQ